MSKSNGFRCEPDVWLEQTLQRAVRRVTLTSSDDLMPLQTALSALPAPAFAYTKVPTNRVDLVHLATAAGFGLVDTNVTLARNGSRTDSCPPSIRTAQPGNPDEREAVRLLAARCFAYSRFHLDPRFEAALANKVKGEWVANYYNGKRGDALWLAEASGKLCGFLLALKVADGWVIDLIGVTPEHQGRGHGKALIHACLATAGESAVVRVGTQVANIPSLRFYEALGFRCCASQYVLHWHA